MASRHVAEIEDLKQAVLASSGASDPALRRAVFSDSDVPEEWAAYIRKVRDQSYRITDADIDDLKQKGFSEEAIFEVSVAAALGAAAARLELGRRALLSDR